MLPGGFRGVDVFFAISGYLITAQLLRMEGEPLGARLRQFYTRRARRILPALGLMLCAVIAIGAAVLLADGEAQDLGRSAAAAALFSSNEYFRTSSADYFQLDARLRPLLHTWSLSVEEQFYLVWPLLLAVLPTRRWKVRGLLVATFGSLALWAWASIHAPAFAFYSTVSRMWELGAGALLALTASTNRATSPFRSNAAFIGIVLVVAAAIFSPTHIPARDALLVVSIVGTVLLLHGGAESPANAVSRFLSQPIPRYLGRVSYAWYLWHWPLISLVRIATMDSGSPRRDVLIGIVALVPAIVSTELVELPIRRARGTWLAERSRALVLSGLILATSLACAGAFLFSARSRYWRDFGDPAGRCFLTEQNMQRTECTLSRGRNGTVYLLGDSHAAAWAPLVREWGEASGVTTHLRALPQCDIAIVAFEPAGAPRPRGEPAECPRASRNVLAGIRSDAVRDSVRVIIAAAWIEYAWDDGGRRLLDATLDSLHALHLPVLLVGPTPILPFRGAACVARKLPDFCNVSRAAFDSARRDIVAAMTGESLRRSDVTFWDPVNAYCDTLECTALRHGTLMFRDEAHLTPSGARAAMPLARPYLDGLLRGG